MPNTSFPINSDTQNQTEVLMKKWRDQGFEPNITVQYEFSLDGCTVSDGSTFEEMLENFELNKIDWLSERIADQEKYKDKPELLEGDSILPSYLKTICTEEASVRYNSMYEKLKA